MSIQTKHIRKSGRWVLALFILTWVLCPCRGLMADLRAHAVVEEPCCEHCAHNEKSPALPQDDKHEDCTCHTGCCAPYMSPEKESLQDRQHSPASDNWILVDPLCSRSTALSLPLGDHNPFTTRWNPDSSDLLPELCLLLI